jgi:hypothetical protein
MEAKRAALLDGRTAAAAAGLLDADEKLRLAKLEQQRGHALCGLAERGLQTAMADLKHMASEAETLTTQATALTSQLGTAAHPGGGGGGGGGEDDREALAVATEGAADVLKLTEKLVGGGGPPVVR